MVEFRPAGLGFWFWVGFGAFVPFSTICLFFPSFNDDLGTMPTRRPYSWKKKMCQLVLRGRRTRAPSTLGHGLIARSHSKLPLGYEPTSSVTLWLKASWLKLAAKAVEIEGSRLLLKEKKFSPGRRA